ncbi:MAG: hydrogenase maturation protease [Planctomycetota bacterium]
MVVIGLGNITCSDEGIGVRVVQEVARYSLEGVEVINAGLPGPELIELLQGRQRAVIVDAIDADCRPGKVFCFSQEDIEYNEPTRKYSLHEGDVLQYIQIAQALEDAPKEIVFVGIQPMSIAPGEGLSAAVEAAIPKAARLTIAKACT